MRNLHAAPTSSRTRVDADRVEEQPAAASASSSEELPAPPPSLVPPQNDSTAERSILSE
jgi:hypothetical protein